MSLVEGVGDEVLLVVGLFAVLCLVLLAWLSTHTSDIPFVSVIVVELSQRRRASSNNNDVDNTPRQSVDEDDDINSTDPPVEGDATTAASSNNNADTEEVADTENSTRAESSATVLSESSPADGATTTTLCAETPSKDDAQIESSGSGVAVLQAPAASSESGAEDLLGMGTTSTEDGAVPFGSQHESKECQLRQRRVAYFSNDRDHAAQQKEPGSSLEMQAAAAVKEGLVKDIDIVALSSLQSSSCQRLEDCRRSDVSSETEMPVVGSSVEGALSSEGSRASCSQEQKREPFVPSPEPSPPQASVSEGSCVAQEQPTQVPLSGNVGVQETTATVTEGSPGTGSDDAGPMERGAAASSGGERGRVDGESMDGGSDGANQIRVRLKYLNDTQRLVYADPQETVGNFRRLHFSSELEENKIIRFIFNGQDLRNDLSTLGDNRINDNSVVHVLITQNTRDPRSPSGGGSGSAGTTNGSEEDGPQMGSLLFPVFGVVLGLVWYLRFVYKQYFNAMSTVSLLGITFIYVLAFVSSVQRRRRTRPHLD